MPHGHCYQWQPGLVWLHVVSDSLITLAYYSIPLTLVAFVRRRQDLPYPWIFIMFGGFIVACGTTHLLEVWTVWYGSYWLSGFTKLMTALLSVATAFALVRLVPSALLLVGPEQLRKVNAGLELRVGERTQELTRINAALEKEIQDRKRAEERINDLNGKLEHRVKELQAVLDILPVGVGISADPDCREIRVNRAFAAMLDLQDNRTANASKSAPAGEAPTHFRVFIGGREVAPNELPMQVAAARGVEVREVEEEIRFDDGRLLHALGYATPLRNEANEVYGSVGAFVDITARKTAELKLAAALSEVVTLKALLPICANCKKIRDDEGGWSTVDQYVVKQGLTKVTHGICPECRQQFYPLPGEGPAQTGKDDITPPRA